jgi:hypothetical protein
MWQQAAAGRGVGCPVPGVACISQVAPFSVQARLLASGLADNISVVHLDLSSNKVGVCFGWSRILARAWAPLSTTWLTKVDQVRAVQLHLQLHLHLLPCLPLPPCLRSFHPPCRSTLVNQVADRGARALAKILDVNSVVADLNLADNHVHGDGGRALARALRTSRALQGLNLRLNRLGDTGGWGRGGTPGGRGLSLRLNQLGDTGGWGRGVGCTPGGRGLHGVPLHAHLSPTHTLLRPSPPHPTPKHCRRDGHL